jgi:hypothetical protein
VDIEAIKARLEAASEGPWERGIEKNGKRSTPIVTIWGKANLVCRTGPAGVLGVEADTDFILNAPTDIAALLSALASERARAEQKEEAWNAVASGMADLIRSLRSALEPFARFAVANEREDVKVPDGHQVLTSCGVVVCQGDLRRAAEVMENKDDNNEANDVAETAR